MDTFGSLFVAALFWAIPLFFFLRARAVLLPGEGIWFYGKLVFTFLALSLLFVLPGPLFGDASYASVQTLVAPLAITYVIGRRFFTRMG